MGPATPRSRCLAAAVYSRPEILWAKREPAVAEAGDIIIEVASYLVAVGVAFGTLRASVGDVRQTLKELRTDVKDLTRALGRFSETLAAAVVRHDHLEERLDEASKEILRVRENVHKLREDVSGRLGRLELKLVRDVPRTGGTS